MDTKNKTKDLTRLALFVALALIMSLLESMLPPLISILPGAKMGLSNVVTLASIILLGYSQAAVVQITRCILGALITGGVSGLLFSLPAGILSLSVMIVLYHFAFPKVSLMGISFVAAVVHNITQVFVACLIVGNFGFMTMLPYYIIMGIAAGLFVGIVCFFTVKYLPKKVYIG